MIAYKKMLGIRFKKISNIFLEVFTFKNQIKHKIQRFKWVDNKILRRKFRVLDKIKGKIFMLDVKLNTN